MTAARRAHFHEIDVTRLIRGALKGGWPVDKLKLVVDGGCLTLLSPDGAPVSDAADLERRMKEAFGEDDGPDALRR